MIGPRCTSYTQIPPKTLFSEAQRPVKRRLVHVHKRGHVVAALSGVNQFPGMGLAVASVSACARPYEALSTAGGFHVPSPAGKIEGGVSLGQYRRITR